jgi:hypothetical protein
MNRSSQPSRFQRSFWFLPILPGMLVLLGAWGHSIYRTWERTPLDAHMVCDVCPEDGYFFIGLFLSLAGIIPAISLFIGGGADRDGQLLEDEACKQDGDASTTQLPKWVKDLQ